METIGFVFTVEQLNTIINALQDAPYRTSAPVLQAIDMQVKQQRSPKPVLKEVKQD